MARDNFTSQIDNESHQIKKQSPSVYFEDKLIKLPESDWQDKKHKDKRNILAQKNYKNTSI